MFIPVYRLAMDARPWKGDGGAGWKYLSLLKDFQTGTASMDRKRHLASSARGFYCFCLAPSIRKLIRSIRLIRGKKRRTYPLAYCPPGSIYGMPSIPRALPPVTQSSAFQAPER